MAITKWSISGLQKSSGLRLLTSPTERAMQKESPGLPGLQVPVGRTPLAVC
jgi:hypothetical protein